LGWGIFVVARFYAVASSAVDPAKAAETETTGEAGDEADDDGEDYEDEDQKRGARNQSFGGRAQDGVNDGDECMDENHLALGRRI
jgi:hypothetical protein